MKTIIVPIDFTAIAENAAIYAAHVAKEINGRIVLFHVYERTPAGSDGTPLVNDPIARQEVRDMALNNLRNNLLNAFPELGITTLAEPGDSFLDHMAKLMAEQDANIVIMGVTDDSLIEQILMGTSAMSIINMGKVPVLIVPLGATYHGIKEATLAIDFSDKSHALPVEKISNILELFNPKLHVVSFAKSDSSLLPDQIESKKEMLQKGLSHLSLNFTILTETNFVKAVNAFSIDKKVDLIMVLPHSHSFISSFFRTSNTEKLVHNTHIPVLAVRD